MTSHPARPQLPEENSGDPSCAATIMGQRCPTESNQLWQLWCRQCYNLCHPKKSRSRTWHGRYFWENQNLCLCSNFEHECNHNSGFSVRDFSNIIPKGKRLPHYGGVQLSATKCNHTWGDIQSVSFRSCRWGNACPTAGRHWLKQCPPRVPAKQAVNRPCAVAPPPRVACTCATV